MAGVLFKAGLDFPNGRLCRICIFNTLKNNKLFLKTTMLRIDVLEFF